MKIFELRKQVILGILSVAYALCLIFGHDIMNYDTVTYMSISLWVRIVKRAIALYFGLNLGWIAGKWIWDRIQYKMCSKCFKICDSRFYWIVFGIIIFFWLPTYITCWPGLGIYDGPCQLGLVSTHHPFLHTLFIHICNSITKFWSGGGQNWLVPYSLTQMCTLAGCFAYAILCLKKWNFPKMYIYAAMLWICIFPMNALMSIASTKDTFFSAVFLLVVCEFGKMRYGKEEYWSKRHHQIRYCILCFLMCALRNNGVYVLIGSLPFLILFAKKYWRKIFLLSVAIIVGYFVYSGPLMDVMTVPKGDKREALTVIIQPLARVYRYQSNDIPPEEKEIIIQIFGGAEPWYVSHISDAPKSQFDSEFFFDRLSSNMELYFKLGLKYPNIYLDAFLANTYGNWYPHEILPDPTAYRMYFEFPEITADEYGSRIPGYYNFLQRLGRDSIYLQVPFLYLFFCTGIVFWVLLFLMGIIVIRKEYSNIFLFAPFLMLFVTIMLGPVALLRYTYPLMCGLVVLIAVVYENDLLAGK